MENIYIEKYRNVINSFYKKYNESSSEMQNNERTYQADVAKAENSKVQTKIDTEREKALNSIHSIFDEIRTGLSIASFPRPELLTADRMFFDGTAPVDMSEKVLQAFVERYNTNFSMLSMIKRYIADTNEGKERLDLKYLDIEHEINTPEDHLMIYKRFAESAVSLIESIYNGAGSQLMIDAFADPEFGKDLFAVIGTGSYIHDYLHLQKIPDSAKHIFDGTTIQATSSTNNGTVFANYRRVK